MREVPKRWPWLGLLLLALGTPQAMAGLDPVETITTEELARGLGRVILVDVRSPLEFELAHIQGAHNLPWGERGFLPRLRSLQERLGEAGERPVVLYCNGDPCTKSREAALHLLQRGLRNVRVYEPGIYEWIRRYPQRTVFAPGESTAYWVEESLAWYAEHSLPVHAFLTKARDQGFVIDLRERRLRKGVQIFFGRECSGPVDEPRRLERCLERAVKSGRPVYFYDISGRQVRFVRPLIERFGLDEYYFLDGGVLAYFEALEKEDAQGTWYRAQVPSTGPAVY